MDRIVSRIPNTIHLHDPLVLDLNGSGVTLAVVARVLDALAEGRDISIINSAPHPGLQMEIGAVLMFQAQKVNVGL